MTHKIEFDGIAWADTLAGARAKKWTGKGKQIRILEIGPGFAEPAWCQKGHVVYVLSGELEIDFQGKAERFSAGDVAVIAAGEGHKARAKSPVARLLMVEDGE